MHVVAAVVAAALLTVLPGLASASQQLAQKHACMNCHKLSQKHVGPAFADVARKYKGDAGAEAYLLGVVKKGGKGVWGDKAVMPPHPHVPEADAKAIVSWVLKL